MATSFLLHDRLMNCSDYHTGFVLGCSSKIVATIVASALSTISLLRYHNRHLYMHRRLKFQNAMGEKTSPDSASSVPTASSTIHLAQLPPSSTIAPVSLGLDHLPLCMRAGDGARSIVQRTAIIDCHQPWIFFFDTCTILIQSLHHTVPRCSHLWYRPQLPWCVLDRRSARWVALHW